MITFFKDGNLDGGRENQPLVSVIIIFLNAQKFLAEAIESVLAQSYHNWELWLVDDGSTDESTGIARHYAEENRAKVRYLEHRHHQNRGMSASRNLGVRHARGDYIAMLDADDVWLPDKLEQQLAILQSHPDAAMVCGPTQSWYSWDPRNGRSDFIASLSVQPDTLIQPPELLPRLLNGETATVTSSLIRREVIERVGGFEESFRGLYEDQVFFAKICTHAPIFVTSHCGYKWRKHPESSCAVALRQGQYRPARVDFLTWLESYLLAQQIKDRRVWKSLRREMWRSRHPVLNHALSDARWYVQHTAEASKAIGRRALPLTVYQWIKSVRESF